MQFAYGFKARANRIAVQVRAKLGLSPIDPIDPWVVCEHFSIEVIKLSTLLSPEGACLGEYILESEPGAFSAITVVCGMRRAIVHNDSHVLVRQRSNLTHEIAHALLGHRATPLLSGDGERHFDQLVEAEAHFLGGALLITNEAAYHIVSRGIGQRAEALYGVSDQMLHYRIQVSGAVKRLERLYAR